jgi:hypothetical protein
MTPGEKVFVSFCKANGIHLKKIHEGKGQKPDYEIFVGKQQIMVEVKDFVLNPEEKQAYFALEDGAIAALSSSPGDRVRSKIDKARRKFKNSREAGQPALIVLFDARPVPFNTVEPYDIKVAMHGFETLVLTVPPPGGDSPRLTGKMFGKDRKFSAQTNTYISGIGLINKNCSGDYELHVYHNVYADFPICITSLRSIKKIRQYELSPNPTKGFGEWIEIK